MPDKEQTSPKPQESPPPVPVQQTPEERERLESEAWKSILDSPAVKNCAFNQEVERKRQELLKEQNERVEYLQHLRVAGRSTPQEDAELAQKQRVGNSRSYHDQRIENVLRGRATEETCRAHPELLADLKRKMEELSGVKMLQRGEAELLRAMEKEESVKAVPDAVIRQQRIKEFRELQRRYTEIAKDVMNCTPRSRPKVVKDMQVNSDAGRLLVDCVRRGWLRQSFPELDKVVEWLDTPVSEEERKGIAVRARVPYNVFVEFVGNHKIMVKSLDDGKVVFEGGRHGGILPARMPESFQPGPYLREALSPTTPHSEILEWNRLDAAAKYENEAKACGLLALCLEGKPGDTTAEGAKASHNMPATADPALDTSQFVRAVEDFKERIALYRKAKKAHERRHWKSQARLSYTAVHEIGLRLTPALLGTPEDRATCRGVRKAISWTHGSPLEYPADWDDTKAGLEMFIMRLQAERKAAPPSLPAPQAGIRAFGGTGCVVSVEPGFGDVKMKYPDPPPAAEPEWVHLAWIQATASRLADGFASWKLAVEKIGHFTYSPSVGPRALRPMPSCPQPQKCVGPCPWHECELEVAAYKMLWDDVAPLFRECQRHLTLEALSAFRHIRSPWRARAAPDAATVEWANLRDYAMDMVMKAQEKLSAAGAGRKKALDDWDKPDLPENLRILAKALIEAGGKVKTRTLTKGTKANPGALVVEPSKIVGTHYKSDWATWVNKYIGHRRGLWWWKPAFARK